MGRVLLRNALLLDPEAAEPVRASLLLDAGRIAARLAPDAAPPGDVRIADAAGAAWAPGFVDLHFHGCAIFAQPAELGAALREDAAALARHGTTAFLTTTVAWARSELAEKVGRLAQRVAGEHPAGAVPIGLHLEGPWINAGAAGAQPAAGIRAIEAGEVEDLLARGSGCVRMVTLAPELAGADRAQEALGRRGVVTALGHSLADAACVDAAVARGARHVTHLFNAMGPLHHREPGLAGAALADDRLTCDVICDGAHVDARMLRVAARAKRDRLVLITDRVEPPAGVAASFGAGPLRDDGVAWRLPDGRLAGSRLDLDRALANAQSLAGLSLLEAVAACTLRPARVLGIEAERGTLRAGARADLVALDAGGRVVETWIGGECVHRA